MPNTNQFPQNASSLFGDISVAEFLADYWQKKPLLIRQAIPGYQSPISPQELASLACSEDVESRIVLEKDRLAPWTVLNGPFYESDFSRLPDTHWTLLVQECNTHVPDFALLLDKFNFIPNWRVDDIMVSYAVKHGSVGPHTDQYDVFLLQGMGTRRWQINSDDKNNSELLEDTDLRILSNFDAENEWILEPGDLLYLPPGVAHYGAAQNDCMTISIGFRAPDHYSLLAACVDDQYSSTTDSFSIPRYQDPKLELQNNCGEISQQSLQSIIDIIQSNTNDSKKIKRWFGRHITEAKNVVELTAPTNDYSTETLIAMKHQQRVVSRSENSKFAFIIYDGDTTGMYINGEEYLLEYDNQPLAPIICNQRRIELAELGDFLNNEVTGRIIVSLFNEGHLYFQEPLKNI